MHFGIEVVPFGDYANPRPLVELALAADKSGWEGFALWDHLIFPYGTADPWVTLSAAAAVTRNLKLLPDVAPLPRYTPQNLARLLTSLDALSRGRLILSAGLGAVQDDFVPFGGPADLRTRAEMLDEELELLNRLWCEEKVNFQGVHYRAEGVSLRPQPVQKPRIPIWIGGESQPALRRAARWDGWIIGAVNEISQVTLPPEELATKVEYIRQHRTTAEPFDVAVDGVSQPGENALAREYAEAGATWYFEVLFLMRGDHEELVKRVLAGPPK